MPDVSKPEPVVSVLLAVFNGAGYVAQAIDSILAQTFRDFELIVVDDGSNDATPRILSAYTDPRMRVISQDNIGLTPSLNKMIELARGRYLARQDADDLSEPTRLAAQVEYLNRNPGVALVGTWGEQIDAGGDSMGVMRRLTESGEIRQNLPKQNEFLHGSIMIRREVMREIGNYRTYFRFAQDYDLVLRLAHRHQLANIPVPLYKKRHVRDNISVNNTERQRYFSRLAQALYRQRLIGDGDSLDKGEPVEQLAGPGDSEPAGSDYYADNAIYLYFRSGNYKKARGEIAKIIRKNPWRLKPYVQMLVTFLGPAMVRKIVSLRDRTRQPRRR